MIKVPDSNRLLEELLILPNGFRLFGSMVVWSCVTRQKSGW